MPNQMDIATLLNGSNAGFIADLYRRYLENPSSVDPSWQSFFAELRDDPTAIEADLRGASWAPKTGLLNGETAAKSNGHANGAAGASADAVSGEQLRAATLDSVRALMRIRAYRIRRPLAAKLHPRGLQRRQPQPG